MKNEEHASRELSGVKEGVRDDVKEDVCVLGRVEG